MGRKLLFVHVTVSPQAAAIREVCGLCWDKRGGNKKQKTKHLPCWMMIEHCVHSKTVQMTSIFFFFFFKWKINASLSEKLLNVLLSLWCGNMLLVRTNADPSMYVCMHVWSSTLLLRVRVSHTRKDWTLEDQWYNIIDETAERAIQLVRGLQTVSDITYLFQSKGAFKKQSLIR